MSGYRLLKHRAYDQSAERLPLAIQRKATWAQVLLGTRGRTPSVKGTSGLNARWRRTPVQGSHFYLWWIPASDSGVAVASEAVALGAPNDGSSTILVHSIRHHDATDDPIDVGALTDYTEMPLNELDPRFDEQRGVSIASAHEHVTLSTLKGLPGSGKSVSLIFLAKDLALRPHVRKIRYITYTPRLKRAAREFVTAYGAELGEHLTVHTFNEMVSTLTGLPLDNEPFGELREFTRYLEQQNPALLGVWRRYPQTLYTEIRAQLLGRTFPPGVALPETRRSEVTVGAGSVSAAAYASQRGLTIQLAEQVTSLAQRLRTSPYFLDQTAAYRGLDALHTNKLPRWLLDSDAIIVDEVQDLTLLQIALIGEMARLRLEREPDRPFSLTVAGDESQIVQPSGFDWGVTKDLLGELVGLWPDEHKFSHQRRSPINLAHLIDNSWNFYGHLPKQLRPSANRQSFDFGRDDGVTPAEDAENGMIFVAAPPEGRSVTAHWQALVEELADKPGRAIVDLSERLRETLGAGSNDEAAEVLFLSREIKGLERATVLIFGLQALYARAMQLCDDPESLHIPLLEARRLFDEMRVALSRSTNRLIFVEKPNAEVFSELGLAAVGSVTLGWNELIELLQAEEMTEIEVIEGYLDEVDDLVERQRWEQAYRRNRRAYDLANQLGDIALRREAQEQFVEVHLQEAEHWLRQAELDQAHTLNRRAQTLAQEMQDPFLFDRIDEQYAQVVATITAEIEQRHQQVQTLTAQKQFDAAHGLARSAVVLAHLLNDQATLAAASSQLVEICWLWADHWLDSGVDDARSHAVAELLTEAAGIMEAAADRDGAAALRILAERYRTLPQRVNLSEAQVEQLLRLARRYLAVIKPQGVNADAYRFVQRWLEESFAGLGSHVRLYFDWVTTAQELADESGYPALDERVWDLENRLDLLHDQRSEAATARFRAFLLGYSGDAGSASLAWEALGEIEQAVVQARLAGDLERSHNLLRLAKMTIPEDIATAVKALRLLQQLEQKHQSLLPAEQQTLLDELALLHTHISASLAGHRRDADDSIG